MTYIIILIALALVGNFLLRKFVKTIDNRPPRESMAEPLFNQFPAHEGEPSPERILAKWGKPRAVEGALLESINPSIAALLKSYSLVGPDQYFRPIDSLLGAPTFKLNESFVQIGVWGDGAEVLAKKDVTDPRIYLADIDAPVSSHPKIAANNLNDFLVLAWRYHQDAQNG